MSDEMKKVRADAIKDFSLPDNFVDIDQNRLHEECARQAAMMFDVGLQLAQADYQLTEAKNAIKILRADLELRIRKNPEDFGLAEGSKPTESFVTAVLESNKGVREASSALATIEYSVKVYKAAVEALSHRKQALESMVLLHGQRYFAAPRLDQEAAAALPKTTKPTIRRPAGK